MTTKNTSVTTRGVIMTLVAGTAWGFSGACGQYLFDNYGINTAWLTSTRLLCAGSILLLFCLLTKREEVKKMVSDKRDMLQVLLFSVFGLIFSQYTYLAAISYCNAGTATVLQYVGPVFVMIYVCLRTRTKPSKYELLAVTLALIGTFLLATHGRLDTLVLSPLGLFWGVCSAFAVMFYTLIPGRLLQKWGTLLTTGFGMLLGGIILGLSSRAWTLYVPLDLRGFLALGGIDASLIAVIGQDNLLRPLSDHTSVVRGQRGAQ